MKTSFDVIAVGMTHAYTAAKQGPRVLVVDTDHQAAGGQCQEFRICQSVTGQKEGEA